MVIEDGSTIDLLAVAPKTNARWADQGKLLWTPFLAKVGHPRWAVVLGCIPPSAGRLQDQTHRHSLAVELVRHSFGTQQRLAR